MLKATTKTSKYPVANIIHHSFGQQLLYTYMQTKEKTHKHENMYTKNAKQLRLKCKKKTTTTTNKS